MAFKVVRQPKRIALIGAPSSAGSHNPGCERAPAALRAAGLVGALQAAGFDVTDLGDTPVFTYQVDEASPRARNIGPTVAALHALKPVVEQAVKSGALPLILGGDCTIALATIAGVKRYFPHVALMYCDGDADLNTPATTPSGCFDGMVVAHIAGRGAPELIRFTSEPPLVREPDIALFGVQRLDPGEEQFLARSPMQRYPADAIARQGAQAAARAAVHRILTGPKQLVLHFDVDCISSDDMPASDFGQPGGLPLAQIREALDVFLVQERLAAVEITAYNPDKDADGAAARTLIELFASALAKRLAQAQEEAAAPAPAPTPPANEPAAPALAAVEPPPDSPAPPVTEAAQTEEPAATEEPAQPESKETPVSAGETSTEP